ncbi:MAG: TrmH family RNA methyltransferase [Polyangiales bacterium]
MEQGRKQIAGVEAIAAALERGDPVRVLLVDREDQSTATRALVDAARARGARVWLGGAGDLRRLTRGSSPAVALAMVGPDPRCDLPGLLARGGAVWLLHRARYASNVGFALRTAEVSGADGVVVDGNFNHEQRGRIGHVSMGADEILPLLFETTERTLELARRAGHRLIALEDTGDLPPWQVDLRGPVVLLVGNERLGIEPSVLARCDAVTALPMPGFVPSYNLQAALSAVALERLRQIERDYSK